MSQHLGPVVVEGDQVLRLEREPLDANGRHTEALVQHLVHANPGLIPMDEIEPAYQDMISLCTELPLKAGFLDNLWITPRGGIVIGECKLFRNPQSRREVIGQALDYARALQRLSFEEFETAVGQARGDAGFRLWPFVSSGRPESETMPEVTFIDGVSRRLREAQVMILIIGDGIREELEDLAEFLQLHAGIHANLALVDISIWKLPDGRRIIIPRLPLKTATIVRGVVRVETTTSDVRVVEAEPLTRADSVGKSAQRRQSPRSGSAEEFLSLLRESDPGSADVVQSLFELAPEFGIEVRFSPQYAIFEVPTAGDQRTAFDVKYTGEIWGGNLVRDGVDPALVASLSPLLPELAEAMSSQVSFTAQRYHRFKGAGGRSLRPAEFKGRERLVMAVLQKMTAEAHSVLDGSR